MQVQQYDTIVIGQGLAGSILAHTLITHGQRVLVIDNNHSGSSSTVAAGIINPITGHRLNISERFFEYYPVAKTFYQKLEKELGGDFFETVKQTRLIKNPGQKDYLIQRQSQAEYAGLLSQEPNTVFNNTPFGTTQVSNTAAVDTKALLTHIKTWLINQQSYLNTKIDYADIELSTDGIKVGKHYAKQLIFCEGYQAMHNPWLEHLPFKLAKGEVLNLELTPKQSNMLLSWGNWLVSAHGQSKLGSTFSWDDLSLETSDKVRDKLLNSLNEQTDIQTTVLAHEAGIRPTTTQRKPFIGPLKNHNNAFCFNGFGSKGCLLIPFYAKLMVKHLLNAEPLPEELTQWI